MLQETTEVFDGARTHDLHISSQKCNPLRHAAPCVTLKLTLVPTHHLKGHWADTLIIKREFEAHQMFRLFHWARPFYCSVLVAWFQRDFTIYREVGSSGFHREVVSSGILSWGRVARVSSWGRVVRVSQFKKRRLNGALSCYLKQWNCSNKVILCYSYVISENVGKQTLNGAI